jgi:glycosyltransferase involved in cell wall biosynthesis
MRKLRILLLADEVPYPVYTGPSLFMDRIIRALRDDCVFDLLVFADAAAAARLEQIRERFGSVTAVRRPVRTGWQRVGLLLQSRLSSLPASVLECQDYRMAASVGRSAESGDYDLALVTSSAMCWYLPIIRGLVPAVAAPLDARSRYLCQLGRAATTVRERLWVREQLIKTRTYEAQYYSRAAACIIVSQIDAGVLRTLNRTIRIRCIPLGVDTEHFAPRRHSGSKYDVVFSGNLAYQPNHDAALFLLREIMPRLWQKDPGLRLGLVGTGARPELQSIVSILSRERTTKNQRLISLTGEVNDLCDEITQGRVFVAPVRYGTGMRVKILEAMAAGMAVVTSSVNVEQLPVAHGEQLLLAESPDEFALHTWRLLNDAEMAERLGRRARETITANYSWQKTAAEVLSVFRDAAANGRRTQDRGHRTNEPQRTQTGVRKRLVTQWRKVKCPLRPSPLVTCHSVVSPDRVPLRVAVIHHECLSDRRPLSSIGNYVRRVCKHAPKDSPMLPVRHSALRLEAVAVPAVNRDRFLGVVPLAMFRIMSALHKQRREILERHDTLWVHEWQYALPFLPLPKNRSLVLTIHGSGAFTGIAYRYRPLHAAFHRLAERLAIGAAARVILVSRDAYDYYCRSYPGRRDKFSFVPTFFDEALYYPRDRAACRRELSPAAREPKLVAFVGRLVPEKRVDILLRGLAELNRVRSDCRLLVAGDGPERKALEDLARRLGLRNVEFLGSLSSPRLSILYNACEATVLLSAFEGTPLVLLESLACGTPVLATPVGDIPRVIQDGRNGRLLCTTHKRSQKSEVRGKGRKAKGEGRNSVFIPSPFSLIPPSDFRSVSSAPSLLTRTKGDAQCAGFSDAKQLARALAELVDASPGLRANCVLSACGYRSSVVVPETLRALGSLVRESVPGPTAGTPREAETEHRLPGLGRAKGEGRNSVFIPSPFSLIPSMVHPLTIGLDVTRVGRNNTGITNYGLELLRQFAANDEYPDLHWVVFCSSEGRAVFRQCGLSETPSLRFVVANHRLDIVREQFVLPRMMDSRKGELDLFHSIGYPLPLGLKWGHPFRRGVSPLPMVMTVHDTAFYDVPGSLTPTSTLVWRLLFPASVSASEIIICDSEFTEGRLKSFFPLARTTVVSLGVDLDLFRPLGAQREPVPTTEGSSELSRRYRLPERFLLIVGKLQPRKNLDVVVDAWSQLKASGRFPGTGLVLAGETGWKMASTVKKWRHLFERKWLTLTGYVAHADLARLYGRAELAIYPSFYEGFGLPVLEAMACGTPAVVLDRPPMNDLVREVGTSSHKACLVSDNTVECWRDAISGNLERQCKQNLGPRLVEVARRYSWKQTARRTVEAYQEAWRRSQRPKRSSAAGST